MAKHYKVSEEPVETLPETGVETLPDLPAGVPPKRRRHLIYDHRILTMFAVAALELLLTLVFTFAAVIALGQDNQQLVSSVGIVLSTLFMLVVLYQFRLRKEFDGVLHWSTEGLLLCSPALLFVGSNVVGNLMEGEAIRSIPLSLVMALGPGIGEEVLFRGIPGSNWLRVRGEARDIMPGVLFTSLVFGLMHGANIFAGASVSATLFQVGYAFCLGLLFGAVMLRTGSIVPSMIMHTLIDFSGFLFMDPSQSGVLSEDITFGAQFVIVCAFSVIAAAVALYLLRPSKHPDIVALWDRKCKRAA